MGVVVPNYYYNGTTRQQYKGHDNFTEITSYYSPNTSYIDVNNLQELPIMPHQRQPPLLPANSSSSKSAWWVNNQQCPPFCFDGKTMEVFAPAAGNNESKIQLLPVAISRKNSLIIPGEEEGEATITSKKLFVIASLLAQCGDIESNPGPKPKKGAEPKPDPQKIMEEKVRPL